MASLNVSMPDDLRKFVTKRSHQMNHATPTEYIRSLVREDQRRADQEKLERLILEGLESGNPIIVRDVQEYISKKKQAFLKRSGSKTKSGRK